MFPKRKKNHRWLITSLLHHPFGYNCPTIIFIWMCKSSQHVAEKTLWGSFLSDFQRDEKSCSIHESCLVFYSVPVIKRNNGHGLRKKSSSHIIQVQSLKPPPGSWMGSMKFLSRLLIFSGSWSRGSFTACPCLLWCVCFCWLADSRTRS